VRLLWAFAAGVLAVGGFAPFDYFPLSIAALALLFWQWQRADTWRAGAASGFAFGLGLFGAGVYWIFISLHTYGGMSAWLAALATFLFCAFLALFPAAAGAVLVRLRRHDTTLLWLAPALWVLGEWIRGWIFTGFPWLALGYSQIPASPLAGFAPLLGIYGVSYLLAVVAALLAWSLGRSQRSGRLWRGALGVVCVLLAGQGLRLVDWTTPSGAPTRVALIQGNIAQEMKWDAAKTGSTLALYARLAAANPATLTILPETALPLFESDLPPAYRRLLVAIGDAHGGDIIAGLPTGDPAGAYYNSVQSFGRAPTQRYNKFHLVPFGEYIPLKALWGWVLDVLHIPLSDFARGAPVQPPLRVGGQAVAMNICYEDAFGEEVIRALPAATVLANVSNDAWFGDSPALWQHAQMSQARAAESGRMMLRATNTGLTAIIDRHGRLLSHLPPYTEGVLHGTVNGYRGFTPYMRVGNAPVLLAIAASLATALARRQRPRRA
jgi:apolipoprotein N-acyltransferase